jgi:hypothetical protein
MSSVKKKSKQKYEWTVHVLFYHHANFEMQRELLYKMQQKKNPTGFLITHSFFDGNAGRIWVKILIYSFHDKHMNKYCTIQKGSRQ